MPTGCIKNSKQLTNRLLDNYGTFALKKTQKIIYDVIQESIIEYYKEYTPKVYQRKFKFLNSLIKTEIVRKGNTISCEVKLDENYLHYLYPNEGELRATGLDVARWANRETSDYDNHGGTVDAGREDGFWDVGLRDLGGSTGIIAMFIGNLKKCGLNVV